MASAKPITEIRLNPDGSLDEVVTWGFVHLEQMSDKHWSLIIDTVDGKRLRVPISSKGTVRVFAEVDGASDLAVPCRAAVTVALAKDRRRINGNRKRKGWPTLEAEGL